MYCQSYAQTKIFNKFILLMFYRITTIKIDHWQPCKTSLRSFPTFNGTHSLTYTLWILLGNDSEESIKLKFIKQGKLFRSIA